VWLVQILTRQQRICTQDSGQVLAEEGQIKERRGRKEYNDEDASSLHCQTVQYQDEHFVYMLLELVQELFSVSIRR
jgi:hypothetical protein